MCMNEADAHACGSKCSIFRVGRSGALSRLRAGEGAEGAQVIAVATYEVPTTSSGSLRAAVDEMRASAFSDAELVLQLTRVYYRSRRPAPVGRPVRVASAR